MDNYENNLIALQTNKEITALYKLFLEILEDIKVDNDAMVKRSSELCGSEIIDNLNYLTKERQEQLRKRILDYGNQCSRQILAFLDYFDFKINEEKVNVASQRKIVKKFTTSSPIIIK